MEKVAGKQGLALQYHFPQIYSKFSKNSNQRINLFFHARDLKLGHFGIGDMLFPFLPLTD